MSANRVSLARDINIDEICYSDVKTQKSGAKTLYYNLTNSRTRHYIQTPEMILPFDMSAFDSGEFTKYTMQMSFRGYEDDTSLCEWRDLLAEMDERIIQDAMSGKNSNGDKYSKLWFKKSNMIEEVVRELYTPMLRVSRDKDTNEPDGRFPPTHRVKLPYREVQGEDGVRREWSFTVYDARTQEKIDTQEVTLEELLVKGARVSAIVGPTIMWFAGSKFGVGWAVKQLRVYRRPGPTGYMFIDTNASSEQQEETTNMVSDSEEEDDSDASEEIEDDDEEDEEESQSVVVKKGRKKVVKKN